MELLGLIVAIYAGARKAIVKEPLKGKVDIALEKTNNLILSISHKESKELLDFLLRISKKTVFFILVLGISLILLESFFHTEFTLTNTFTKFFALPFFISGLLFLALEWIKNHKKSLKSHFLNPFSIFLAIAPVLIYIISYLANTNMYSELFGSFIGGNIIAIQILWVTTMFLVQYFILSVISLFVYYISMLTIVLIAAQIKLIHKYINEHLLDIFFIIITLGLAFFKILL